MEPIVNSVSNGNLNEANKCFPEKRLKHSNDRICYLLEKGTLKHLEGQFDESNQIFDKANSIFDENDQRAKISVGKILEGGGSLIINDKMRAYEGEPYERILMHSLQAINYLMLNLKEEARIEIKRAYEESKILVQLREKEIENCRVYAKGKSINEDSLLATSLGSIFSQKSLNDLRKRTINPYQNAFTSYLSSIVYEMNNNFNDAYIDCISAYEIDPNLNTPKKDLARLASMSGLLEQKEEWDKIFGLNEKHPEKSGELIILFQCGLAAHKEQIWFPIPIPIHDHKTNTYSIVTINISFPRYVSSEFSANKIDIIINGQPKYSTEVMADLDTIALQNFYDRLPAMLIRLCIRASLKATAEYNLKNQLGKVGNIDVSSSLSSAAMAFTEQADLRSWLLAPANLQFCRCKLPAGEQPIDLVLYGKNGEILEKRSVIINIKSDKFTIINVRAINNFIGEIQVSEPL